ncbi:SDR family NAD(P)-dependent oxidoreductase [Eoetvoesiella caeni]|uniref:3-oxoacyl-[acyl-carrier protein] reductase n=1 Tax=Eoetvoesiella caeni TaxID=645616 RepID=A0A366HH00_9BURK|nr:glucose 1-dehydrogenase [Eoetvoesiella caeni]MCI2808005.1 glucose 1-dehydrogenase [Eoetvoesiella caeni]NYT53992.1 glucose 1-dehydrogenase [Eoetvoesiella caeni]RBP41924.1 3-oxoacyl-[acyl-carrier protein] reductase [Eoetvoesiella caeni]
MPDSSTTAEKESSVPDFNSLLGVQDRVVIITGAGQGIGRIFAHAFAAYGAVAVVADLNKDKADIVAREIEARGHKALALAVDIGSFDSLQAMAQTVFDAYGRIDVLINNAGIFSTLEMRPFWEIPLDEWDKVMHVNITGVMLATRAVIPYMQRAKWGRIVNISSASILMGRPNYTHYTTSKSALIGMTRSMARELGNDYITVNAVLPGATQTEIPRKTVSPQQREAIVSRQCVPRTQVPQDLVGAVVFLATEGSRFMTGQVMNVDGGASHSGG